MTKRSTRAIDDSVGLLVIRFSDDVDDGMKKEGVI